MNDFMAFTPRNPYDHRMDAVRFVTDRLLAVAAYPRLRERLMQMYPACAQLRVSTRESEHDYWVFAEVLAIDRNGSILGEPPFQDHVLGDASWFEQAPDTARHFSDADTVRLLGQPLQSQTHLLDLEPESYTVAIFDLLEALNSGPRLQIAYAAADYAGGTFTPGEE